LERGYDQTDEVLEEDEVVFVRPGQLVTVGLHCVMVRVWVMVEVDVVVPSWAATREAHAARMLMMLLNCILILGIFAKNALECS